MKVTGRWPTGAALVLTALLAACGGGGGGDNGSAQPGVRPALPTLAQDIAPEGARIDLREQDYFVGAVGDSWTYDHIQNGSTTRLAVTRTVTASSAGDIDVIEIGPGSTRSVTSYARSAQGLVDKDFLGAGNGPLKSMIGDVLVFAEPFYAVGATRRVVRQGSAFEDLDGDGVLDSLRLEFAQDYLGQQTVLLPDSSTAQAAGFRSVSTITLSGSSLLHEPVVLRFIEDSWWVAHVGMVKTDRSGSDVRGNAVLAPYTLQLAGASVGGRVLSQPAPQVQPQPQMPSPPPPPQSQATVSKITLAHNSLVFDASRGVYYASVPGSVIGNGNRIATIDAGSGAVSYSAPVGSEPAALALAADGSSLYVGLNGSGDVVRLGLPGQNEISRTRLPVGNFGQLFAEAISVPPQDASVMAVSMFRIGVSPRHGGVALIRSGVLQPTITQDHTGSNLISFDANGQFVYGFNTESSEFGLRRLDVLADGLREVQVVTAASSFDPLAIDWTAQGLVLGNVVYKVPELSLLGRASTGGTCRPQAATGRLVCHYTSPNGQIGQLAVVDMNSFVILSTVFYDRTNTFITNPPQLLPGPAGQVALRVRDAPFNTTSTAIWLVQDTSLR